MSADQVDDGETDRDAAEPSKGRGTLRRVWQSVRAAGQWVADTFKVHSGAHQLREREC